MRIEAAPDTVNFDELVMIWEKAVRATHHFLSESQIAFYRDLVRHSFLRSVELVLAYDEAGNVAGFIGLQPSGGESGENGGAAVPVEPEPTKVSMLFVDPLWHGQGTGRALLRFAGEVYGTLDVDVNEQNPGACRFYEKCGFFYRGRSETDEEGNPFPLLHLRRSAL
jgi:putative acetyltransferase